VTEQLLLVQQVLPLLGQAYVCPAHAASRYTCLHYKSDYVAAVAAAVLNFLAILVVIPLKCLCFTASLHSMLGCTMEGSTAALQQMQVSMGKCQATILASTFCTTGHSLLLALGFGGSCSWLCGVWHLLLPAARAAA
jgi:hypothetical protein